MFFFLYTVQYFMDTQHKMKLTFSAYHTETTNKQQQRSPIAPNQHWLSDTLTLQAGNMSAFSACI